MSASAKLLERLLSGQADANLGFVDLLHLLDRLGFVCRVRGSHHILHRPGVEEILNLQPKGSQAKPYQVKQVRALVLKYQLSPGKHA